jgi:transcriptional regulator with XRE-family HTH domain
MNEEKNEFFVFQERFKMLRGKLTQAEFAKKIGISRPTVGFYENGERLPDASILKKIAEKCDVSADWLIGLADIPNPDATDKEINKKLALSAEAINTLKRLSAEYDSPQNLHEIEEKISAINNFISEWELGYVDELPPSLTDEEKNIYGEYLQNKTDKENLSIINLLLSSGESLKIINCMAKYFEVRPDTKITANTEQPGVTIFYNSSDISGMYAQKIIAVLQELRNKIRETEGNGE